MRKVMLVMAVGGLLALGGAVPAQTHPATNTSCDTLAYPAYRVNGTVEANAWRGYCSGTLYARLFFWDRQLGAWVQITRLESNTSGSVQHVHLQHSCQFYGKDSDARPFMTEAIGSGGQDKTAKTTLNCIPS